MGFPAGSDSKESACSVGDPGSIPGSGVVPWKRVFQYSCLENPRDRGAWWATVLGIADSQTQLKQLSVRAQTHTHKYIFGHIKRLVGS